MSKRNQTYPTTVEIRELMGRGLTLGKAFCQIIEQEATKAYFRKKETSPLDNGFSWLIGEKGTHRNLTGELDRIISGEKLTDNGRHLYFNTSVLPLVFEELKYHDPQTREKLRETVSNATSLSIALADIGYRDRILPLKENLSSQAGEKLRAPLVKTLYRLAQALHAFNNSNN